MKAREFGAELMLAAALAIALVFPAWGQIASRGAVSAPEYGSGTSAGTVSNRNLNSPESDGRPGVYYFNLGAQAFKKGDYAHAIDMYKVAASWAYKPAEYNLALMYFNGRGVPIDRARGAAWAVLAAERGEPFYTRARDAMVTMLTDEQFKRTDEIWNQLKPTYGDAVALQRAKSQWRRVASQATGSHLGHATGNLRVGGLAGGPNLQPQADPKPRNPAGLGGGGTVTAAEVLAGGSEDGSVAYKQFQQSDNPYAAAFERRRGTATVGALKPVKPEHGKAPSEDKNGSTPPPDSSGPQAGI